MHKMNTMRNIKKYISMSLMLAMLGGFSALVPTFAFADTNTPSAQPSIMMRGRERGGFEFGRRGGMMKNGIFGTVASVNGNMVTVTVGQLVKSTATSTP